MRKKRALTLLEVIISLSLTAILLAILMGSATRLFSTRTRIETAKQEVLAKTLIQERLSSLFFSLTKQHSTENDFLNKETEGPLKSLDGKSLTVWLEHQIDLTPAFCGSRKGEIFLDNEKLIFQLTGKNGEMRKEVLLDQVEFISFQFFDPFEEPPRLIDNWKERTGELPSHLILTIESPSLGKRCELAFFFPSDDNFVVYHPVIKNNDEARR